MAFAEEANAFFLRDKEIPDSFDDEEAVPGFFVSY